jgi:hypothetical protein
LLVLKIALYSATSIGAFLFAFMELRLKRKLTDDTPAPLANAIDFGILDDLSDRVRRERVLASLPRQARSRLRVIVGLKFLCVLILITEVLLLQR